MGNDTEHIKKGKTKTWRIFLSVITIVCLLFIYGAPAFFEFRTVHDQILAVLIILTAMLVVK